MQIINYFRSSLRRQISAGVGLIVLLSFAISALTLIQLNQIQPLSAKIYQDSILQQQGQHILLHLIALDAHLEKYILFRNAEQRENVFNEMQGLEQAILEIGKVDDPEVAIVQTRLASLFYMNLRPQVQSLLDAPSLSVGETNRLTVQIFSSLDALRQEQQALSEFLADRIRQSSERQTQIANRVQVQTVLASVVSGIVVLGILILLQLSLKQITLLTEAAAAIQKGNLSQRVPLKSQNELGLLANTFNTMAESLQSLVTSLEQRVQERTKALQTLLEISRRLSAATDPNMLATDVVKELQAAFGYYHAHIYFLDKTTGDLIMAGGTGEAGAAMLAAGHTIHRGQGLVGRAAATKTPILVPDVSQAIGWLPNPLLPETKSEAAVPILLGEQVLGVLDVQQNRINGLTEDDVALLQSVAAQVAISLQNAQIYTELATRAELEATINYIGQRIQNTHTIQETLQTALRETSQVLGAKRILIKLVAPFERKQIN
ncbi:MAG: GAF domain-containing protein [Anaerolineales bacterium]|nr:GAF domain-containing protein [Anaerolineales bacterium]